MPNPVIVYSLDASGGQLAYLMEENFPTFPETPHIDEATSGTLPSVPDGVNVSAANCVNVRAYRNAVVQLTPSDLAATYDVTVYGGNRNGKYGTGAAVDDVSATAKMHSLDGYTFEGLVGLQTKAITVFDYDWIFVLVENLSAGNITVQVGYHRFVSTAPVED